MLSPAFAPGEKAPDAFRTISEVAQELDLPQHVLRFWESRFSQIKPVKRAGGRRYYRPEDIDLLKGIRALLYSDGLTIRGVQKLFKDRGPRHVAMIGRGDAKAMFAAPSPVVIEKPVVVEKVVYVEKPAPRPAPKKRAHLRAVPGPEPMSLPFFDSALSTAPVAAEMEQRLARAETVRLESLLGELQGLKARLGAARRRHAA